MTAMLDALKSGRTLVFGHRGASAYAPMNTLPAFELAARQGAEGIELDVHLTLDGVPVIIHDDTVDHTTDGTGRVNTMTLAQIRALDAGSWFDAAYTGTRIPTLDEVFESVGARLLINVEIKSLPSDGYTGIEKVVGECIDRHAMRERVIVSSFNPMALSRFRYILPDVLIGFLHVPETPPEAHYMLNLVQPEADHPHHPMIDAKYMDRLRREGRFVNTWTVNEPERARELAVLGVNAIITDKPDAIREALA